MSRKGVLWQIEPALISLISDRRRRARRKGLRVDLDHAVANSHPKGRELLGEGRRRAAVGEPVLVAVPGTGHAAIDDAPLADRAVLVRAQIRERADLAAVAKHRDALAAGREHDAGALVRDVLRRPDRDPTRAQSAGCAVGRALAQAGE